MRLIITGLLICMGLVPGMAQNTFQFKGLVVHNKSGPKPGIKVIVDGVSTVTNNDGVFVLALPNTATSITVSLEPHSGYTILYPYGGTVLVPRDLSKTPQLIIGDPKDDLLLQQYLRIYQLLKNKQSASPADIAMLNGRMDSLYTLLIKMNRTDSELRLAKEMQDGRDDYLPLITADIIDYGTKAADLKATFSAFSNYAFNNSRNLEELYSAMNRYNVSYGKLSTQRITYEQRIGNYWQSDSLRNAFRNLSSLALDTIHKQTIYPMQATIDQIRTYFTGGHRSEDLKNSILQNIASMMTKLEKLLPKLDSETRKFAFALAE